MSTLHRLFRRHRRTGADDEQLFRALFEMEGSRPCGYGRCSRRTGLACEYEDRNNRPCATAWCPSHRFVIDGRLYCRRHAAVINALPPRASGNQPPLPDVDSRAPGLVNWVSREVDNGVRSLLLRRIGAGFGARLAASPVTLVHLEAEGAPAWERRWTVVSSRGSTLVVAVVVAEDRDSEVIIRVGERTRLRATPPWISDRNAGGGGAARAKFRRQLLASVAAALKDESAELATPPLAPDIPSAR